MKTIWTDAETAGVVQGAIDKAGLDSELEVEFHPWVPQGWIIVGKDYHTWELVSQCYAGVRVLL